MACSTSPKGSVGGEQDAGVWRESLAESQKEDEKG